jgi:hypothetical protein
MSVEVKNEFQPIDRNFRPPTFALEEQRGWRATGPLGVNDGCYDPATKPVYRTWCQANHFSKAVEKKHSFAKAMLECAEGETLTGVEREVNDELQLKLGRNPTGFFAPDFVFTRADLAAGTGPTPVSGTAGQSYVPLVVEPSLIEVLRPFTFTLQAGATKLANLTGDISIPRQTAANTATWAAENAQISRTSPTFDQRASRVS